MFVRLLLLLDAVALLETVYASATVNQFLATSVKRMALGTNFNLQLAFDGAGRKCFTTGATHGCFTIVGMYFFFHCVSPFRFISRFAWLSLYANRYII